MAYETISYEKENSVATVTLNRPQALNGFVPQMNKEVLEALKDGERDSAVRCFVITGAGRAFCAGQDLKGRTPEQKGSLGASLREKYNPMIRQIRPTEKIVIAAVNGAAPKNPPLVGRCCWCSVGRFKCPRKPVKRPFKGG